MSGVNSDARDVVGSLGSHCQSRRWCVGAAYAQRVPRRGPRRRGDALVPRPLPSAAPPPLAALAAMAAMAATLKLGESHTKT
eukprot:gene18240-biopygen20430